MKRILIAKSDFGGHTRGSKITDANEIEALLAGENAHHVIQSMHDDPEIAAPRPARLTDTEIAETHAVPEPHEEPSHDGTQE